MSTFRFVSSSLVSGLVVSIIAISAPASASELSILPCVFLPHAYNRSVVKAASKWPHLMCEDIAIRILGRYRQEHKNRDLVFSPSALMGDVLAGPTTEDQMSQVIKSTLNVDEKFPGNVAALAVSGLRMDQAHPISVKIRDLDLVCSYWVRADADLNKTYYPREPLYPLSILSHRDFQLMRFTPGKDSLSLIYNWMNTQASNGRSSSTFPVLHESIYAASRVRFGAELPGSREWLSSVRLRGVRSTNRVLAISRQTNVGTGEIHGFHVYSVVLSHATVQYDAHGPLQLVIFSPKYCGNNAIVPTVKEYRQAIESLHEGKVGVVLPLMRFSNTRDYLRSLYRAGYRSAFVGSRSWNGPAGAWRLGGCYQKASIDMSSYSHVSTTRKNANSFSKLRKQGMRVMDRPFVFFLRDPESGLIHLAGIAGNDIKTFISEQRR